MTIQKARLVQISDHHCKLGVKTFPDSSNFTYFVGVGAFIVVVVDVVVGVDLDVLVFIEMDRRFTIVKTLR